MSDWYGTGTGKAAEIATIKADLQSVTYLRTDTEGRPYLDIPPLLVYAQLQLDSIPAPVSPLQWLFPGGPSATNLRPLFEKFNADLLKIAGTGVGVILDIKPLLADCEVKSKAVTDYYSNLFNVVMPDLLDGAFETGNLDKNIPPLDDLTKKTVYWRYTAVNDWGQESQPSPVSVAIEQGLKDTVTVAREGVGDISYAITHWRAYRSNSGSQGAAWQYIPNPDDDLGWPVATIEFTDDIPDSELQEVMPSLIWAMPDDELSDIQAMNNGIHVGVLKGRTLCPSENYKPFTFPFEYRKAINEEVVKLLGWDGGLFVATRGRPYFLFGTDAATMTLRDVDGEACVSPESVCLTKMGPVYASPDGLCLASPGDGVVRNLTAQHFSREEWQAIDPETLIVREHDGVIFMLRPTASSLIPLVDDFNGTGGTALLAHPANDGSAWVHGKFCNAPASAEPLQLSGSGRLNLTTPDGSNNQFDPVVNKIMPTADYYAEIEFFFSELNVNNQFGVVLRNKSPGVISNEQFITVCWQGTNQIQIGRAFNTSFGANFSVAALAINTLHTLRAEVSGSTVTAKLNGVTIGSVTVTLTDPTSPGRAGICGYSPSPTATRYFTRFAAGPLAEAITSYALSPSGKLVELTMPQHTAAFQDRSTDTLYVAGGTDLYALQNSTTRSSATWTRRIVQPKYESYSWLKVVSDFTDADGTAAAVTVTIANATGTVLATNVVSSREPVRVAPFRELEIVVSVTGKARVAEVVFASSAEELKDV